MIKFRYLAFSLVVVLASCSIKPEPIQYGMDGCSYCSMTIVDRQHAAELVTSKGKAFKFDASECMINHLKEEKDSDIALYLVNDFSNPGDLVDARAATFLISENIPSPMGAYLSAFKDKEAAENVRQANEGVLLNWEELLDRFSK